MVSEVAIAFSRVPTGVVLVDPDAPLPSPPPPVAPVPGPTAAEVEREQQWRAEQERRWQEEHLTIERVLSGVTAAIQRLEEQQQQRLADMRRVAVELGLAVASRLVHEKLNAGDFAIEALVRKVVEQLEPQQPVTVRLHPQDKALLEQRLGGPLLHDRVDVRVVVDAGLERGNCRAECGDVSVLSNLEDQLAEIRSHLLRSVQNDHAEP